MIFTIFFLQVRETLEKLREILKIEKQKIGNKNFEKFGDASGEGMRKVCGRVVVG